MLLFSCSNNTVQTGKVQLATNAPTSRTLLPDSAQPVASYDYELKSQFKTYKGTSDTTTITFDKVLVGNYTIDVKGKNDEGIITQHGATNVKVLPGDITSATVQLFLIDDEQGATGSLSIPIDWSAVINEQNFASGLEAGLKVELIIDGTPFEQTQLVTDNEEHKTVLTFTNIPVGKGLDISFNIYNSANGQLLVRDFFKTTATISKGHISVPDDNEKESGKIEINNIVTADNIFNIKLTPDVNSSIARWTNPQKDGKNTASKVVLTYTSNDGETQTITVIQDEDMLTGTATLTGLSAAKKYFLTYSTISFAGAESPKKAYPYSFAPLIFIEDLIIDESGLPQGAIKTGAQFTLNATVSPYEGTNHDIIWNCTPSDVFTISGSTFTAKKPGTVKLTATTVGVTSSGEQITKALSKDITVTLASPNISATIAEQGIAISWTGSIGATSYELYEIVDGAPATRLTTLPAPQTAYLKADGIVAGSAYSYYVKAIYSPDPSANSELSNTTEELVPVLPTIEILPPKLQEHLTIEFAQKDANLIISEDHKELIFKLPQIDTITTYEWYVNGTLIKSGDYNLANFVTIDANTKGVYKDASYTLNSLLIKLINDKGEIYSATVRFEVVDVLDTGVEVYIEGEPDAPPFIPTTKGQFQLTYRILPENASNPNLLFSSSDTTVATVSPTGLVTILKDGDVKITVSPVHGEPAVLNFKFYTQTFSTQNEILNVVNGVLNEHITKADSDSYFNKDWWPGSTTPNTYKTDNVEINSSYGFWNAFSQTAGSIAINDLVYKLSEDKDDIITLNTTIPIQTWAKDLDTAGYGGTDVLEKIGYQEQGKLIIELPFNQGSVAIQYCDINVYDANPKKPSRSGEYILTFDPIVVDEQHSYKLFENITIEDSESVTRLFN